MEMSTPGSSLCRRTTAQGGEFLKMDSHNKIGWFIPLFFWEACPELVSGSALGKQRK